MAKEGKDVVPRIILEVRKVGVSTSWPLFLYEIELLFSLCSAFVLLFVFAERKEL